MAKQFLATFLKKEEVAEGTMAFYFEKPGDFSFAAGQHVSLTVLNHSEPITGKHVRIFSIASPPQDSHLMITTRQTGSEYKNKLWEMEVGGQVKVDGPYGRMVLPEDVSAPLVFLAGGIGITPFYSMLRHPRGSSTSAGVRRVVFFYANRQEKDAIFLNELRELEKQNENFKFVPTMTKLANGQSGEMGYINALMIRKYVSDLREPIFYIAGPQRMSEAMFNLLGEMGIGDERINSEEFSGY